MWNSKPLFLCHGSKANYGRLNWCDSFFIAKTDFFECGEGEGGGASVSCFVLIVIWPSFYQLTAITPAQNLEFLIL